MKRFYILVFLISCILPVDLKAGMYIAKAVGGPLKISETQGKKSFKLTSNNLSGLHFYMGGDDLSTLQDIPKQNIVSVSSNTLIIFPTDTNLYLYVALDQSPEFHIEEVSFTIEVEQLTNFWHFCPLF